MPAQGACLVLTRVVEHQHHLVSFFRGCFHRHRVEESLEYFRIAVRDGEAHELAAGRIDRADHVLPDVSSEIALGGPRAAFDPFRPRAGIAFEPCLVAEEDLGG